MDYSIGLFKFRGQRAIVIKTPILGIFELSSSLAAGCEGCRRIVGRRNARPSVIDIALIADDDERTNAERICILSAKDFIFNRDQKYQHGSDYVETIKANAKKILG